MASVFLSYAREDAARAGQFARVLGEAGHEVWWDLHIRGGAQFSKVIDEALKAADVVVVLWSQRSIESAWVRDEAAAGRDSGRLVPVTIDRAEPPLGFRQYQTIDLSAWKGRGSPPPLRTLLEDISAAATSDKVSRTTGPAQPFAIKLAALGKSNHRLFRRAGAILALLIVVAAAGLFWLRRGDKNIAPSVSVLASDNSPLSHQLAKNVLVKLGSLQSISAIAVRLPSEVGPVDTDIHLAVSEASQDRAIKANVSVVSGRANDMLWSRDFEMAEGGGSTLEESVAFATAGALVCAAEVFSDAATKLSGAERRRYMNACASLNDVGNSQPLISTFRSITGRVPGFAPAWAHLLKAEVVGLNDLSLDEQSRARLRADIVRDLSAARRVQSDLPEATIAEVEVGPASAFSRSLQLLDRANADYPANTAILAERSSIFMNVGRTSDAVNDAKAAAALEPFSPELRALFVTTLAYAGGIEKAWGELAKIKQLWPTSPEVLSADYAINLRFGDYEKTVRASGQALEAGILGYIKILQDPTQANVDAWVGLARSHQLNTGQRFFVLQALGPLNRVDQLFELIQQWPIKQDLEGHTYVLFRPWMANVRRDPRFMGLSARLGLVEYWRSGRWPDFCSDPDLPYNCEQEAAKAGARL